MKRKRLHKITFSDLKSGEVIFVVNDTFVPIDAIDIFEMSMGFDPMKREDIKMLIDIL